jgi:hypothetical protein
MTATGRSTRADGRHMFPPCVQSRIHASNIALVGLASPSLAGAPGAGQRQVSLLQHVRDRAKLSLQRRRDDGLGHGLFVPRRHESRENVLVCLQVVEMVEGDRRSGHLAPAHALAPRDRKGGETKPPGHANEAPTANRRAEDRISCHAP